VEIIKLLISSLVKFQVEDIVPSLRLAYKTKLGEVCKILTEKGGPSVVELMQSKPSITQLMESSTIKLENKAKKWSGSESFVPSSKWVGYIQEGSKSKSLLKFTLEDRGKGDYIQVKVPGHMDIILSHTHNQNPVSEHGQSIQTPSLFGGRSQLNEGCSYRKKENVEGLDTSKISLPKLEKGEEFIDGGIESVVDKESNFSGRIHSLKDKLEIRFTESIEDEYNSHIAYYRHYKGSITGSFIEGVWWENQDRVVGEGNAVEPPTAVKKGFFKLALEETKLCKKYLKNLKISNKKKGGGRRSNRRLHS